jgi:hypothetical protein
MILAMVGLCALAQPAAGDVLLSDLLNGQNFTVGDKAFTDWGYTGFFADPNAITISPLSDPNGMSYGLRFSGPWSVSSGDFVNMGIEFQVDVDPNYSNSIYQVQFALGDAAASGTGTIAASELMTYEPLPTEQTAALLNVAKSEGDAGADLNDMASFEPASTLYVRKDISISSGTDGEAELAHFDQWFVQVPEPTTIGLMTAGLALLTRRRKR